MNQAAKVTKDNITANNEETKDNLMNELKFLCDFKKILTFA